MENIEKKWIEETRAAVRKKFSGEASGHDFFHMDRVFRLSNFLADKEGENRLIVSLGALLHDIADWKFHGGDLRAGPNEARKFLTDLGVAKGVIDDVCEVVANVSFKGAGVPESPMTLAACIVQDADRLDAIGCIGVARCFAYGGLKGHPIHDPAVRPVHHESAVAYIASKGTSVNHFYEKLLLLKDRMHTKTARRLAEQRHARMEAFLQKFLEEWHFEERESRS